jgi:Fe2+ transport system protein FeoA
MAGETSTPIPLTDLAVGGTARLHAADIDRSVIRLLRALGLTQSAELRLCKTGEPCIIQVRATRIGLSREIADRILVVPIPRIVVGR